MERFSLNTTINKIHKNTGTLTIYYNIKQKETPHMASAKNNIEQNDFQVMLVKCINKSDSPACSRIEIGSMYLIEYKSIIIDEDGIATADIYTIDNDYIARLKLAHFQTVV